MARDNSKGRGKFTDPIEIKYIQLHHDLYKSLFIDGMQIPEASRKEALWHFIYHYFTNTGYEGLKLKDPLAYMICKLLDESHFRVQNNSRWRCFDEFYEGRDDIDYEMALDNYNKKLKERKRESNKAQYNKRKQMNFNPGREHEEGKENLKEAMKKHGIDFDEEDFNY